MLSRIFGTALLAGGGAGLLAALLHFAFIQPKIVLAEAYESGRLVHFDGAAAPPAGDDVHVHDDGSLHDHGSTAAVADPGPAGLDRRSVLTAVFSVVLWCGFGLFLVAGFAIAERFGRQVRGSEGILWGLAGFVSLHLAPALGLPPELPGSLTAAVGARQTWWIVTALATATGLAALAFAPAPWMRVAGVVALALPHLAGAPAPDGYGGRAPPEIAAAFAAAVLGVAAIAWTALGWSAARLWDNAALSGRTATGPADHGR
jgi:cobalt transporter subunit CbtA